MKLTDYFAFASLAIAGGLGLYLVGEVPLPSLWIIPLALLALGLLYAFWRLWRQVRGEVTRDPGATAFADNCPILERDGDNRFVGRCWYHSPEGVCPRHGDIREALKLYHETGKLTPEPKL